MKVIREKDIKETVKRLCIEANFDIGEDVREAVKKAAKKERSPLAREVLKQIEENHRIASTEKIALCQDTGMCVVFLRLGSKIRIEGDINEAVNQGVREAYEEEFLRKSVVSDPLFCRKNTKDNTPAIIHTELNCTESLEITVCPKGFGSENMSKVKLLPPAAGKEGVVDFVVETIREAMANPCPPVIVGVGIGGDFELCALLAKKALLRPLGSRNPDERYGALEEEMLEKINRLNIGPSGTGGDTTCLGVMSEFYPTHIASIPVGVNVCCHASRHKSAIMEGEEI